MRARGFTLIELLVVTSIVAVLFGVALERLLKYQEMAERAALEQNLAAMNTALALKFAAYVTAGRGAEVANEAGKNPVALLARPPENYLGELYAPEVSGLERRSWYFDRQSAELVYLPHRRRYLSSASAPPDSLRFRIALLPQTGDASGLRVLQQPFIVAKTPFVWSIE